MSHELRTPLNSLLILAKMLADNEAKDLPAKLTIVEERTVGPSLGADSIRAGIALEEIDLEYLEDPCVGIEGMSQVKAKIRIPLCTNMCVVRFEEFAPAMRLNAVDVIHGDVYKWGGIAATKAAHAFTKEK